MILTTLLFYHVLSVERILENKNNYIDSKNDAM